MQVRENSSCNHFKRHEWHARGVRVCWLHPTKELPQSEAMQGALPFIHRAMPAHNLASLARLPDLLRSTLFSNRTQKA